MRRRDYVNDGMRSSTTRPFYKKREYAYFGKRNEGLETQMSSGRYVQSNWWLSLIIICTFQSPITIDKSAVDKIMTCGIVFYLKF